LTHHIEVSPGTPDGRRFRVTKPTYFRATNQHTVKTELLTERMGCCSQAMFLELSAMLDRYCLALPQRQAEHAVAAGEQVELDSQAE